MLADLLDRDLESIRMIAPDVGGGFGPKAIFYPEEAVIPAAALKLGRPVKWIEDRREHFLCATQERDQYWDMAIAVDADGKILGVRGSMLHDSGAFVPWGIIMPYIAAVTVPGPLRRAGLSAARPSSFSPTRCRPRRCAAPADRRRCSRWSGYLTAWRASCRSTAPKCGGAISSNRNRCPTRSAGCSATASRWSMTAAIIREDRTKRCGSPTMKASASANARHSNEGRLIGIGIGNYVEGTGLGPFEGVTVRVLPSGKVAVATGATNQGQGTRTTLSQIVAEQVGCRIEDVVMTIGDTGAIAQGVGAFASRQAVNAGCSAQLAGEAVRKQIIALAARALGVNEGRYRS